MTPTVDSFHALARSSPWRWRTLHFTHRGPLGVVEAWLRRPGRMLVRYDGREHRVDEALQAPAATLSFHGPGPHVDPELPDPAWPQDVVPPLRPDGLVAERPDGWCPLPWGELSEREEWSMGGPTFVAHHPDVRYPSAYEIALDVRTGVVVRCRPLDGSRDDVGFEVDIHDVDADLDHLFPG